MSYTIRPAAAADGAACAGIYAPYTGTAITFESPAPGRGGDVPPH